MLAANDTKGPVAALVLAAGSSSRLGQPKQLLLYQGETLLHRAVRTALAADCEPVIVVTGALDAELHEAVADLPCTIVHNANWASGMGSSVQAGLAGLVPTPTSGVDVPRAAPASLLLLLCDQPLLTVEHLQRLISLQEQTGKSAVATTYASVMGVPVVFGAALFGQLQALRGGGAQQLLKTLSPAEVGTIDFPGAALDVDTPAQYQQLLATTSATGFNAETP